MVGGNDVVVAVLMLVVGVELDARTILTSRSAESDHRSTCNTKKEPSMESISTGLPARSVRSSRMHGGGVMGRRSLSPNPHMRAL